MKSTLSQFSSYKCVRRFLQSFSKRKKTLQYQAKTHNIQTSQLPARIMSDAPAPTEFDSNLNYAFFEVNKLIPTKDKLCVNLIFLNLQYQWKTSSQTVTQLNWVLGAIFLRTMPTVVYDTTIKVTWSKIIFKQCRQK